MPPPIKVTRLDNGLYCFHDTCNVYVVRGKRGCLAIDFGSGRWLSKLKALGLPPVERVMITHHHPDQCAGLLARKKWPFAIDVPAGDQPFFTREGVAGYWEMRRANGVPSSYAVLPRGLPDGMVEFSLAEFTDTIWNGGRVRFISTPGHGRNAISILLDHNGKQVVFCGDAASAGATIHEPYHLEWDHWTGGGALAAWEGVLRLSSLSIDLLCPSHGPVTKKNPRRMLDKLAARLIEFYRVKGSIAAGEPDHYIPAEPQPSGARKLLPSLYQFSMNGYLVLSTTGEALVIDTMQIDGPVLKKLLAGLGNPRITTATATHCHIDHVDGLPLLKREFGAEIALHPWVAAPLRRPLAFDVPWLPAEPILADRVLPENGRFCWNEFTFRVAPFPGQTRWHACLMTRIDGRRVLFAGDSFQPASRWNGTGGFCAMNGSTFAGFRASARRVIAWKPDLIVNGHDTYVAYHRGQFEKIIAWSYRAERATRALCPSGDPERDYYLHPTRLKSSKRKRESP